MGKARSKVTLITLAGSQTDDRWANTISKYSYVIRSILMGAIHLKKHGYQHYDIKGNSLEHYSFTMLLKLLNNLEQVLTNYLKLACMLIVAMLSSMILYNTSYIGSQLYYCYYYYYCCCCCCYYY